MKLFIFFIGLIGSGLLLSGCTTSIEQQLIESPCKECQNRPVFYDCGNWVGEKE